MDVWYTQMCSPFCNGHSCRGRPWVPTEEESRTRVPVCLSKRLTLLDVERRRYANLWVENGETGAVCYEFWVDCYDCAGAMEYAIASATDIISAYRGKQQPWHNRNNKLAMDMHEKMFEYGGEWSVFVSQKTGAYVECDYAFSINDQLVCMVKKDVD